MKKTHRNYQFVLHTLYAFIMTLLVSTSYAQNDYKIYVSPQGNDANNGSIEKPFQTMERAKLEVRKIKSDKPITVFLRGGTYPISKTVVFGLEDSGSENAPITYTAYPGETPILSSGRNITGWKKVTGKIPGLPAEAEGKIMVANVSGKFRTLYDSEGMLPRARSAGFIPLKGSRNKLNFPKGKLKDWDNIEDVEIVVRPHHAWIMNILPLKSVDEKTQTAITSIDATYGMNVLHFLRDTENCWVENVIDELNEPGEWVLNTKEGKLYLWPRNETPVVAPQLIEYILVEGKINEKGPKDIPVQYLNFSGLTFTHGDRYQLTPDDKGLQHDWDMLDKANALIRFRGTAHCTIENSHFLNSGSGAIRVDLHGQNIKIADNHIEHMGGGGILLSGYGPGTKDVNKNNLIYNNNIHHVGEIYWHSPGIFIWQSGDNRIANNLIHHTNYTNLIISGCMTDFFKKKGGRELARTLRRHEIGELPEDLTLEDVRPYLHTRNNIIEANELHNGMQKMGDGNAIYIRGAGAGNVITRNYIHDMVAPMIMQCAIRTDGGQMDTTISENLIYNCVSQGIMLKLNNICENNIVANIIAPPRGYYLSVREGPMTGASIKKNIFYSMGQPTEFINELQPGKQNTGEDARGRLIAFSKEADTDSNIYFSSTDADLGKTFLDKQQADGVDKNSQSVDPLFVDPANGDFRFIPNSPAIKMGIKEIDISKIGLIKKIE